MHEMVAFILNYFEGHILEFVAETREEAGFIECQRVKEMALLDSEQCIYVMDAQDVEEPIRLFRRVLIIQKRNPKVLDYQGTESSIIVLDEGANLKGFCVDVRHFIQRMMQKKQFELTLLQEMVKECSLQHFIQKASDVMGHPLILIDVSYRILAHSNESQITDTLWQENVRKGYCSFDFIAELKKLQSVKEAKFEWESFIVTCPRSPNKKLTFRVMVDQKIIGYVFAIECFRPISALDHAYIQILSRMLSTMLGKNKFYQNIQNPLSEELILDLLEDRGKNQLSMQERIKIGKLKFGKHMMVMVADLDQYEKNQKEDSDYLNTKLLQLFPEGNAIYYNGDIVIISDEKADASFRQKLPALTAFLAEHHIIMGVSSDFSAMEELYIHYSHALTTVKIGQLIYPDAFVHRYEDVFPYVFLYHAKGQLRKEDFFNKSLYALKEYDEAKGTDLYHTLYVYLKNNHDLGKSAQALFIHRNTLRYRLEKCFDLIDIDLNEKDNSFKLYYAYKAFLFYKKLNEGK